MPPSFPRIQAAAVDGRLHNIYHRQVQLERLCKALIDNVNDIKTAIAADHSHTSSEIAVEYHLALTTIKKYYALLKPEKAHDAEYLIANGKNSPYNTVPKGIVYIEPTSHTLFYSAVVPLAAALTAGNCVILLLENNLRAVSSVLRQLLVESLDADVFAIASSPVKDEGLLSESLCVLQSSFQQQPRINELVSLSKALVVAVVDRTADVQVAARELVLARVAFGGSSPYAPDCVLVNEYTKKDFLQAVLSECVKMASGVKTNDSTTGEHSTGIKINEQLDALRKDDPGLRTIIQDSRFAVIDLSSKEPVLRNKLQAPILAVHGIKSLDDAIDLVESRIDKPCLAAYHFGNLATGKYLSQFIDSEVSLINHVPPQLLVGPALPTGHAVSSDERYPIDLFALTRPAYLNPSAESTILAKALSSASNGTAIGLLGSAVTPLAEFERNPGGGVGFFEQGFLITAGMLVTSSVAVSATGLFWLWRSYRPL